MMAAIKAPHVAYRWGDKSQPNPLNGYLAYADRILVTMDSIAMVADALSAGKPVSVYRLEPKKFAFLKTLAEWFIPVSRRTEIIKRMVKSGDITWFDKGPKMPKQEHGSRYAAAVSAARNLMVTVEDQ
jgi:mitochondrial fission protein ELM1